MNACTIALIEAKPVCTKVGAVFLATGTMTAGVVSACGADGVITTGVAGVGVTTGLAPVAGAGAGAGVRTTGIALHCANKVTFSAGIANVAALAYEVPDPDKPVFHPVNVYPSRVGTTEVTVAVAVNSIVDDAGAVEPPLVL